MSLAQPTDTDYRFAIAVALIILMGVLFGLTLWKDGGVQNAISTITPFIGLISIIINSYFKTKE